MHNTSQKFDLDLRGTVCPMAFVKLRLFTDQQPAGTMVQVLYEDSAANEPLARSTAGIGHSVVSDELFNENAAVGTGSGANTTLKLMTVRIGS